MQRNLTSSAYTTTVYTTTIYSTVYNLQYYLCYGSYYSVSNPASPLSFPPSLPKPMRGSGEASASVRNSPQPVRGSGEASASAPTPLSRCAAWGRPAPVPPAGARLGGVPIRLATVRSSPDRGLFWRLLKRLDCTVQSFVGLDWTVPKDRTV